MAHVLRYVTLHIETGTPPETVMVPVRLKFCDATKAVHLHRTEVDALNGAPGYPITCMDAMCITREKKAFPHPVFAAYVGPTVTYIVDRLVNGLWAHAVRYERARHDKDEIRKFDQAGGKKRLLQDGTVDRIITFLPPRKMHGKNRDGSNTHPKNPRKRVIRTTPTGWLRAARTGRTPASHSA